MRIFPANTSACPKGTGLGLNWQAYVPAISRRSQEKHVTPVHWEGPARKIPGRISICSIRQGLTRFSRGPLIVAVHRGPTTEKLKYSSN